METVKNKNQNSKQVPTVECQNEGLSTISSYLRLKIPKTYLLTNWIYRSPSFAWICLFYIHIISLSSILDRPSRWIHEHLKHWDS
jgi:hypothetical protein